MQNFYSFLIMKMKRDLRPAPHAVNYHKQVLTYWCIPWLLFRIPHIDLKTLQMTVFHSILEFIFCWFQIMLCFFYISIQFIPISNTPECDMIPCIPLPYRMRSARNGFSHGHFFTPDCGLVPTFWSPIKIKKPATTNVVTGFLVGVSGFELFFA